MNNMVIPPSSTNAKTLLEITKIGRDCHHVAEWNIAAFAASHHLGWDRTNNGQATTKTLNCYAAFDPMWGTTACRKTALFLPERLSISTSTPLRPGCHFVDDGNTLLALVGNGLYRGRNCGPFFRLDYRYLSANYCSTGVAYVFFARMDQDEQMRDRNYCLQKKAEYRAKARIATDPKIRLAYEAAAREFVYRAALLPEKAKD
jgi:hypothetical protein